MSDFIGNDPEIKNAHDEYEKFLSDEHLQHLYLAREMYQNDEATRIAVAKENRTIETTKSLKDKGVALSIIAESTGLSLADINNFTS